MVYYSGSGENRLAVLLDSRTANCREIDDTLGVWGVGNRFLGKANWKRTLRIALREHKAPSWNAKEVAEHRAEVLNIIKKHGITTVLIVQSPPVKQVKKAHNAWNLLGRSGDPYKWAGTVLHEEGLNICPVLHPAGYEYAYNWLIHRWFVQALALAQGRMQVMPWPEMTTNADWLAALGRLDASLPLSVDLETNTGGGFITAIGLSDGRTAVSVPWEGYKISGRDDYEPGITAYPEGAEVEARVRELLAANSLKVGHNFAFDVYQLRRRGFTVNGEIHDTLLAARTVYPQFRRGLQQAAAIEFCVEPWKSLWKPPRAKKHDDIWLSDPRAMRVYNAKDAYVTALLHRQLQGKMI